MRLVCIASAIALGLSACAPVAEPAALPATQLPQVPAARTGLPADLCPGPAPAAAAPSSPGGGPPPPSTPPPPVPPPPPEATAYLQTPLPAFVPTGDARFDAYVRKILYEGGTGWHPYLLRMFAGLKPNPAILAENAALRAPRDAAGYVRRIVTPERIARGRTVHADLKARNFVPSRDVPLEYIVALWGVMSDYGDAPPRFDMIETYLNLGACGTGPSWGYFDLFHAARLIAEGRVERSRATAYGNGRIGQVQWFPDQYVNWGKDGDDIWRDPADILARLTPNDWERGIPPIIEVERPVLDRSDPGQARMWRAFQEGSQMGLPFFRRPGGGAWPSAWLRGGGRFVAPFGDAGPFFVLTYNFTPINFKNPFVGRYESSDDDPGFGIAVALLADQIAGRPGPSRPIR